MKRLLTSLLALTLSLGLTACGGEQPAKAESFAMDTVMTFSLYGEEKEAALAAVQREMNRLEALLSRTREDSPVARLNAAAGGAVDMESELLALLAQTKTLSRDSGGAFDPTVAPVVDAWGFTGKTYRIPTDAEVETLLGLVGEEKLALTPDSAKLAPGTAIDLGGIAKGYAADRVAALVAEAEVPSGVVSLGGNVYACGTKPDGTPWRAGIQDPLRPEGSVGTLALTDAFAVTSGGYQRYFEENGKRYHHIIDPATGHPAESGLLSVTIVARRSDDGWAGTRCDAFSTALFVMGEEKALDFWRNGGYDFQLVLVTADKRVLVSEGLADTFEEEASGGYVYETVSKTEA